MAKKKTKSTPKKIKKIKTKAKLQAEKAARAKPETRKEISKNLKHLDDVAEELGVGCEIYHDDALGGYVVNLSDESEDRSFGTAAEVEEFLHEQEEEMKNPAQYEIRLRSQWPSAGINGLEWPCI